MLLLLEYTHLYKYYPLSSKGHSVSVTGKHIPDFADQLTAAAKVKVFHNDHHDVSANAFATKTMPLNPVIPNFNTFGGSVDYKFK